MAVTATFSRQHKTDTTQTTVEYATATLGGTYLTGGFTSNLLGIVAGPGSSPAPGSVVLSVDWQSPSGYTYRSSTAYAGRAATTTTRIFSGAGTELAGGSAMPDATCPVVITKRKT